MSKSLGLFGDLCCEVEWILKRLLVIRSFLHRSHHQGLISRLKVEAVQHVERCGEIRQAIHCWSCLNQAVSSPQLILLDELLLRCRREFNVTQMSPKAC